MGRNFGLNDVPDQTGKVVIVTGASTGIGRVCATTLAKMGAHVFLACRNEEKTLPVIEEIKSTTGNDKVEFLHLDLISLESVKNAADTFKARGLPLHLLLNNAGIMAGPFKVSKDGIESQFATNHLAHFYFTTLLLPVIESSAPSRIVNVSSALHYQAKELRLETLNDKESYGEWQAYARSKLCNILFTKELAQRLEAKGAKKVWVNSLHPGVVQTDLVRSLQGIMRFISPIANWFMLTAEEGATTQMYLSTSKDVEDKDIKGQYYVPNAKAGKPTASGCDDALAKQLWVFSEETLKEKVAGYEGAGI